MPININCTAYRAGRCTHQAAPKKLFGTSCIVAYPLSDVRVPAGCALQVTFDEPRFGRKPEGPGNRTERLI